jgi:hypothetical protein
MTMSGKIKVAALAAVLTVVSVHGTASANYFPAFPPAPKYQSYKAVNRSKAKIPSNAFGSIGDRTGTSHLALPVFGWEGAYGYQPSLRRPSDFQHRDYDGYQRGRQLVGDRGGQAADASNGGATGPSE